MIEITNPQTGDKQLVTLNSDLFVSLGLESITALNASQTWQRITGVRAEISLARTWLAELRTQLLSVAKQRPQEIKDALAASKEVKS